MLLGVTKGYVVDRKTLELKMFLSLLVCYLAASFGTEHFKPLDRELRFGSLQAFSSQGGLSEKQLTWK